ncbi:MAG: nuclear transport factor 2 family protein [Jatrophihabitans sp.]
MADRVADHLNHFNAGVRSGDWLAFLATFAEHARVEFTGAPAGPYLGRDAIVEMYRSTPPDDTIEAFDIRSTETTDTIRFEWGRGGTGTLWLAWTGRGEINRMVVDIDVGPPA